MWDLVDKKVFRSRDIIFMEDKTLADWESEKKIKNSEEIRPEGEEGTPKQVGIQAKTGRRRKLSNTNV